MGNRFAIKGITDDVTTCECCGRRGLRRTVALMPLAADGAEDGEVTYYGTSCAARALNWSSYRVNRVAVTKQEIAVMEQREELRQRAQWALPHLERNRAVLVERMTLNTRNEGEQYIAFSGVNRLGMAVWHYAPGHRQECEEKARVAYTTGGLRALLELYDYYLSVIRQASRMSTGVAY